MPDPDPQPQNRSFTAAAIFLGSVALLQLCVALWIFATESARRQTPALVGAFPSMMASAYPGFAMPAAMRTGTAEDADPYSLARPTPVDSLAPATGRPAVAGLFEELLAQARTLRERGDMAAALTKLREAQAVNPASAEVISEMAHTYESMGLFDKAIEQWRRVIQIGPQAGILFSLAETKLQNGVGPQGQETLADLMENVDFNEDASFAIGPVQVEPENNPTFARSIRFLVPIKSRQGINVIPEDVIMQVLFYDMVDDTYVVQTSAVRESEWITEPADWQDNGGIEILQITYRLPFLTDEDAEAGVLKRDYLGYSARLYYEGILQDTAADPVRLLSEYPPPPTLETTPSEAPPISDESLDR